jgi:hypothetical protein
MRTSAFSLLGLALALSFAAGLRSAVAVEDTSETPGLAVGAQYDGAQVYLAPAELDAFVKSFTATFGGEAAATAPTTVTPTPSGAMFAPVRTPAGPLSVLAFTTPIPYPFGSERVGYFVKDLDPRSRRPLRRARASWSPRSPTRSGATRSSSGPAD